MSCPTVIRVSTKGGPPGIGLPAGSAQQDGFAIVKDGATPYLYKLVELNQLGLPQALGITASPTFAGLTLTGLQNQAQGLVLVSTTGQLQRVSIGSGLAIQSGALVATATGGGSGTVTSVSLAAPTGFTVSGSPVTTNGTLTFNFETGYSLPTTAKQNQWDATTTALASHLQAADPHSIYTTEIEVNAIIAALTHLDVSVTGAITQDIRNDSGATMAAGTPYHVVGAVGDTSRMRVIAARADDPATMPANGILQQTLTATGGGADGHGVVGGVVTGLNTAGGTEGATIWVGLTGGISLTRPATNPQPIGTLSRVHAATGSVAVAIGPVLHPVAFSGAYGDLSGRPTLATVATSGSYGDLSGRPTLGTAAPLDVASTGNASAAQVVKGDDTRLSDSRPPLAHSQAASTISDSTAVGRALVTAADAAAARSVISAAGSGAITASGLTVATARLLGRTTAGTGAVEEIQVSGGTFTGGVLTLFNPAVPGAIGGTTPSTGAFTVLTLPAQAIAPAAPADGFRLFADATGRVSWRRANGWIATLDLSVINADRTWSFPNRAGTIALTDEYSLHVFGTDTESISVGRVRLLARAWQETTQFISLPLWELVTAPSGAAAVFDIRVAGTSIYSTPPSIASGATSSSANPGVFSAAFVSANQTIAAGSLVEVWCTQIGVSPNTGQGLRSQWYTRRAD